MKFDLITGIFPAQIKRGLFRHEDLILVLTTKRLILLPLRKVMEKSREGDDQQAEISDIPILKNEELERMAKGDKPLVVEVESEGLNRLVEDLSGRSISLSDILNARVTLKDKTLTITHRDGMEKLTINSSRKDLRELKEQLKALLGERYKGR
ncbi:hypothetical protein DRO37_03795 [Candidatus Bathyarchaeota archaeon]|nr:MAG: hypothetical protein DRO37_03795 [Candidatus Bathyarchaeota archaeon]